MQKREVLLAASKKVLDRAGLDREGEFTNFRQGPLSFHDLHLLFGQFRKFDWILSRFGEAGKDPGQTSAGRCRCQSFSKPVSLIVSTDELQDWGCTTRKDYPKPVADTCRSKSRSTCKILQAESMTMWTTCEQIECIPDLASFRRGELDGRPDEFSGHHELAYSLEFLRHKSAAQDTTENTEYQRAVRAPSYTTQCRKLVGAQRCGLFDVSNHIVWHGQNRPAGAAKNQVDATRPPAAP
jgi:hypothetical protein